MTATVTILQEEITREERLVGLPPDRPLTDAALVHRRVQIAVLLGLLGLVSLVAMFTASGSLRLVASILALAFGYYALEQEQHLQRLTGLKGDANLISLVVADELVFSGALEADRELLDLRIAIELAAPQLAAGLAGAAADRLCPRPRDRALGRSPHRGRTGPGTRSLPARQRRRTRAPSVQHRHSVRHARAVTIAPC